MFNTHMTNNPGVRDARERVDGHPDGARGNLLLGADPAAGHHAGSREARPRRRHDPGDGAHQRTGHAHRRAPDQGHQRRAEEAPQHLPRDPHAPAAALPGRAHQRARQRRLVPRDEPHRRPRRHGGDDHRRRRAPALQRGVRALPWPLLARRRPDHLLWPGRQRR